MTRSGCSACTALSASVPVVTTVWRSSSARKEGDFSSRKTAVLLEVTSLSMRDPLAKITTKQWGLAGALRPELRGTAGLAAAPVQPPLDSSPCGRTEARPAPAWTARPAGARRLGRRDGYLDALAQLERARLRERDLDQQHARVGGPSWILRLEPARAHRIRNFLDLPAPGGVAKALGADGCGDTKPDAAGVELVHLGLDARMREIRDGDKVRAAGDGLARLHEARDDDPVDRSHDARLLEHRGQPPRGGGCQGAPGPGGVAIVLGVLERLRGCRARCVEALLPRNLALEQGEVGVRL